MKEHRAKIFVATWLYRWSQSQGLIGALFSAMTWAGVFTLLLGPVFQELGIGYSGTLFFLLALVGVVFLGLGFVLDRVVKFWTAQAKVSTVRNPWLFDRLYEKEALTIANQHLPVIRALRELVKDPERIAELDRSIVRLEKTVRDGKWTVRPEENVYGKQ